MDYVFEAITKRAISIAWKLERLEEEKKKEEKFYGMEFEELEFDLLLPDAGASISDLRRWYLGIQGAFGILSACLRKIAGYGAYLDPSLEEDTLIALYGFSTDDVLRGISAVFYRKDYDEDGVRLYRAVVSLMQEKSVLGFKVRAKPFLFTEDPKEETIRELLKAERKEVEEEKVKLVYKAIEDALKRKEKISLLIIEKSTGLEPIDVAKAIGYLVKRGDLELSPDEIVLYYSSANRKVIQEEEPQEGEDFLRLR